MSEIDDLLEELTGSRDDQPRHAAGPTDAAGPAGAGGPTGGTAPAAAPPTAAPPTAAPPAGPPPVAIGPEPRRARDAGIVAAVAVVLVVLLGGSYLLARPGSSGTSAEGAGTTAGPAAPPSPSAVSNADQTTTVSITAPVAGTAGTSTTVTAPATTATTGPATTAPSGPTTAVDPATAVRSVVVDSTRVHLVGRVPSPADVTRIVADHQQRWGATAVVNELVVDPTAPAVGPVPVSFPVAVTFASGSYTVPSKSRWMLGIAADMLAANPGLTLRATIYAAGDEPPVQGLANAQHRLDALQQALRSAGAPAAQIVPDLRSGPAPAGMKGDPDRIVQLTMVGLLPS